MGQEQTKEKKEKVQKKKKEKVQKKKKEKVQKKVKVQKKEIVQKKEKVPEIVHKIHGCKHCHLESDIMEICKYPSDKHDTICPRYVQKEAVKKVEKIKKSGKKKRKRRK